MIVSCRFDSPIGILYIQANEHAVTSAVFAGENSTAAVTDDDHPLLQQCCLQLREYFDGSRQQFTIPMEQQGTSFQQKVWQELQRIPFGSTISYLNLSKKIGDAKAIRAVGTTNGKNQLAILVPCHRVIGSNGQLTGYAGGLWRKQWLLEHEAVQAKGVQRLF